MKILRKHQVMKMRIAIQRKGLKQMKQVFESNLSEKFKNNKQDSLEVDKYEEITQL